MNKIESQKTKGIYLFVLLVVKLPSLTCKFPGLQMLGDSVVCSSNYNFIVMILSAYNAAKTDACPSYTPP